MLQITAHQVQFDVVRDDASGVRVLRFMDPRGFFQVAVPFDAPAWETFQRFVDGDGDAPVVQVAKAVPRMDVPRSRPSR